MLTHLCCGRKTQKCANKGHAAVKANALATATVPSSTDTRDLLRLHARYTENATEETSAKPAATEAKRVGDAGKIHAEENELANREEVKRGDFGCLA